MNADSLIVLLRDSGTVVTLENGKLKLSRSKPSDEIMQTIRLMKIELILCLAMELPLRPQRKWPTPEVEELSSWLDGRSIDDRVWVSNRALLYDDRDGFTWKSDCYAIKDIQEVVEPESLQIAS